MVSETMPQRFERLLNRSGRLRVTLLVLANSAGCALMLSPVLALVATTGGAVYVYNHIQGPLDWFMFECLMAASIFSAYLTWQLTKVRPEQLQGVMLKPEQAPELFKMLERRSSHFRLNHVEHINLSTETELKLDSKPTWVVPAWHRHTLCIGASLLFFLSQGQFRLGLAGAVAVAANQRKSLQGWLAQAANDWPLIIRALENNRSLLSRLLMKPATWLTTHIDDLSAKLCSDPWQQQVQWVLENSDEQSTTDLLSNQLVATAFMEQQYWPMIFKAADRSPTPVVKAFSHLPLLLDKTLNRKQAERWLMEAQTFSKRQDTRVRDMLAELRIDHLTWPGLPPENAFDSLFENAKTLKQLDVHWQSTIEPEWRQAHERYKNDERRFNQLKTRALEQGLRGDSALKFIRLAPQFMDNESASDVYQEIFSNNTNDPKVCFACGLALLRNNSSNAGIAALQRAESLDPTLAKRARALITEHRNAWVDEESSFQQPRAVSTTA